MSENGEIYTAGKNFTLPLVLTAWTNSTSGSRLQLYHHSLGILPAQGSYSSGMYGGVLVYNHINMYTSSYFSVMYGDIFGYNYIITYASYLGHSR